MANHKSAKKRILRNEKKRIENHSRMSAIRTFVKRAIEIISGKKEGDAKAALAAANSHLARGVKKGIVKKNRMARVMSKLSKKASAGRKEAAGPAPAAKAASAPQEAPSPEQAG
ncbi:MAG: 30S ribosomal protein S20 [Rickettsiales bacterium]|jgi:small subunit ribosomal protein S20|nr:30S ribosomal protein S20 [Rickettsiales bacterium]